MATNEEHREDLIAEATALVERIELQLTSAPQLCESEVIIGYRRSGFLGIYLGQDLSYQFDCECRLRRSFIAPSLYRAQYGTLCRLDRVRSATSTTLYRTDLTDEQSADFVAEFRSCLQLLNDELLRGRLDVIRIEVAGATTDVESLIQRICRSISSILDRRDDFFSRTIKAKRLRPGEQS